MTARFSLKAATEDVHRQLDDRLSRLDLAESTDYRRFLRFQGRTVPPLESVLAAAGLGTLVEGWAESRRSAALRADLEALGEPAPPPAAVPAPAGTAQMLGMAYVVEGSRLGGRLLGRQVGRAFPRRFLAGDGSLGPWPVLVAVLDRCLYSDALLDEAQGAARRCFRLFLDVAEEAGI